MLHKKIKCHECEGVDCYSRETTKVCKNAIKCYTMRVQESNGAKYDVRGCILERGNVQFYCSSRRNKGAGGLYNSECCDENMCNRVNFTVSKFTRPSTTSELPIVPTVEVARLSDAVGTTIKHEVVMSYAAQIAAALICLILLIKFMHTYVYRRCTNKKSSKAVSTTLSIDTKDTYVCTDLSEEYSSKSSSSCSSFASESQSETSEVINKCELLKSRLQAISSYNMELTRRTIAHQVSIIKCLSNGSFGRQIWHGKLSDEDVAIKIFTSREQESFFYRETEVYFELLTERHEHVLNCVGWDTIKSDQGTSIQHWLVTQYHSCGSLYDYLLGLSKPLDHQQTFDLCLSMTKGLLHLHTEISGVKGKPSLAHRNLTSKNIMVKQSGICAIGDFGYSVDQKMLLKSEINLELGCVRYKSPEILNKKINTRNIENFFYSDIYSLALIFWEVCRKCSTIGAALDYAAPYSEWLKTNQEPSLELMHKLVVEEQHRPTIPGAWQYDPMLSSMAMIIKDCWRAEPSARLTAMRIKKSIMKLGSQRAFIEVSVG